MLNLNPTAMKKILLICLLVYTTQAIAQKQTLNVDSLNEAAAILMLHNDFTSFSKRNTQVNNFICRLSVSEWIRQDNMLIYHVAGNRFLRGMVKGLVGTMLLVGSGKITIQKFEQIILSHDCTNVNFSVPPHGLFLNKVIY